MRKLFSLLASVLLIASVFAQSPQKMSYQAVIRNSSDALVTNTQIGMEINIRQGTPSGTIVYTEAQTPTTNASGLVSIEIGGGAGFDAIDWSAGSYFIETKTDPTGGTNYTITGTSQLLSVPYALHAKTAENVTGGFTETDPRVPTGNQIGQMQYWNGVAWVTVQPGISGEILLFINGKPTWGIQGMKDGDVYNPTTGKIWMDRNLGASQVATSLTDSAAYGDTYQWGRAADGHQIRTSGTTTTLATSDNPGHGNFILNSSAPNDWRNPQNNSLWQGVSGINNPCPSGYRIPTQAEWEAERTSWSSNNGAGAFASSLKLPMGGLRSSISGAIANMGTAGYYWSSTVSGVYSYAINIYNSSLNISTTQRSAGESVRCIKD